MSGKPKQDLTGHKYGRLAVIGYSGEGKWNCRCDCGQSVRVKTNALTSGNTKSCGCLNAEKIRKPRRNSKELAGTTTPNGVRVISYLSSSPRGTIWECICPECGKTFECCASDLQAQKSCGCLMHSAGQTARENLQAEVNALGTNVGLIAKKTPNKNNKTGIRGVCFLEKQQQYVAYIGFQGRRYILKRSKSKEECVRAREIAEQKLHDNFLQWYAKEQKS